MLTCMKNKNASKSGGIENAIFIIIIEAIMMKSTALVERIIIAINNDSLGNLLHYYSTTVM